MTVLISSSIFHAPWCLTAVKVWLGPQLNLASSRQTAKPGRHCCERYARIQSYQSITRVDSKLNLDQLAAMHILALTVRSMVRSLVRGGWEWRVKHFKSDSSH